MTLAGIWENDYHSKMTLSVAADGLVTGFYESTTGSTGKYVVIGRQTSVEPSAGAGQAAALAIHWHSIVAGPEDNSWHWVSGLSGQLSLLPEGERLVLSHALVASIDFPGLADAATYIDKLVYRRSGSAASTPPVMDEQETNDPSALVGTWRAPDGTEIIIDQVTTGEGGKIGYVTGQMLENGVSTKLDGVTDILAVQGKLRFQSLALVGLPDVATGPAISWAGTLDLQAGILSLLDQMSASTPASATYVQTSIQGKQFTKVS